MITRFDHAIIATPDLDHTTSLFNNTLGLDTRFGGRHTGRGTHNALTRFGLDYLELLGVADAEEVRQAGAGRMRLLDFLEGQPGGLLAYCLATDDIDALAKQFRDTGLDAVGPFSMERMRPDGLLLKWKLLIPGGAAYRNPWPFFIQWELPDDERLSHEQPGSHPLGATRVSAVVVAAADKKAAQHLYSNQLGLTLVEEADVPQLSAVRLRYRLQECNIDLLIPKGIGPIQNEIDEVGEGVYAIVLTVPDLEKARQLVGNNGLLTSTPLGYEGMVTIDPMQIEGTRFYLTA